MVKYRWASNKRTGACGLTETRRDPGDPRARAPRLGLMTSSSRSGRQINKRPDGGRGPPINAPTLLSRRSTPGVRRAPKAKAFHVVADREHNDSANQAEPRTQLGRPAATNQTSHRHIRFNTGEPRLGGGSVNGRRGINTRDALTLATGGRRPLTDAPSAGHSPGTGALQQTDTSQLGDSLNGPGPGRAIFRRSLAKHRLAGRLGLR